MRKWTALIAIVLLIFSTAYFVSSYSTDTPIFPENVATKTIVKNLGNETSIFVDTNGSIDVNGITWADISALFPVPDANISSVSWSKLFDFPSGCPTGQFATAFNAVSIFCDNPSTGNGDGDITGADPVNEIFVANGADRLFGSSNVVLSLPQGISTTSGPTFDHLEITNLTHTNTLNVDGNALISKSAKVKGVLSPDDLNASFKDLNDVPNSYVGQALKIVQVNASGTGLDFNSINLRDTNCSGNASCVGVGDILGKTNQITVTNGADRLFSSSDVNLTLPQNIDTNASVVFRDILSTNGTNSIQLFPNSQAILFDSSTQATILTSSVNMEISSTEENGNLGISGFASIGPTSVPGISLGRTIAPFSIIQVTDGNIARDLNVHRNVRVDGNVTIDGNIFCVDANCFLGTSTVPVFVNGQTFDCYTSTNGNCVQVAADYFAFGVRGAPLTGMTFRGTDRYIGIWSTGTDNVRFGTTGSSDRLFFFRPLVGSGPVWAGSTPNVEASMYIRDYQNTNDFNQLMIRRNGSWQNISAIMTLGTPNDLISDANWIGDINATGDWNIAGNIHSTQNLTVDINAQITGKLNVDGNIFGQVIGLVATAGTSCNSECGALTSPVGSTWTCITVLTTVATGGLCTDTLSTRNCVCQN